MMLRTVTKSALFLATAPLMAIGSALGGVSVGTTVTVDVSGVANSDGHVLVALCPQADFLTDHCPYHASAPAHPGDVPVIIDGVPPGHYAAQAFHDDNDTKKIERSFFGLPRKALGFSRDAPMRFGPPRFDAAEFSVGSTPARTQITLRYP